MNDGIWDSTTSMDAHTVKIIWIFEVATEPLNSRRIQYYYKKWMQQQEKHTYGRKWNIPICYIHIWKDKKSIWATLQENHLQRKEKSMQMFVSIYFEFEQSV